MFCVIEEAVSLIFFSKFDSVDIILERRSIAICIRSFLAMKRRMV